MRLRIENILYKAIAEGIAAGMEAISSEVANGNQELVNNPGMNVHVLTLSVIQSLNEIMTIDDISGEAATVPEENAVEPLDRQAELNDINTSES